MLVSEHVNIRTLSTINDKLLVHPNWRQFESSAHDTYAKYHEDMKHVMKLFNAPDEESLITQAFISQSNDRELKDQKKVVEKHVRGILSKYRKEFDAEFDTMIDPFMSDIERDEKRMAKASAWFLVARKSLNTDSKASLAFPWIVTEYLTRLSKKNYDTMIGISREKTVVQQCIHVLDQALKDGQGNECHGDVLVASGSNSSDGQVSNVSSGNVSTSNVPSQNVSNANVSRGRSSSNTSSNQSIKPYQTYPNQASMALHEKIEAARSILVNWLNAQTHLSLQIHKERKERMIQKILDILNGAYTAIKYRSLEAPSIGEFVLITFLKIVKPYLKKAPCDVWAEKSYDFKYPLELTVLITLTKFCRSHDAMCILSPTLKGSPLPKVSASFYMDLRKDLEFKSKVIHMKPTMELVMKHTCGVDCIKSEFDKIGNRDYLRINAYGTKWNLIQLKNIIAQKDFCSFVLNSIQSTFYSHERPTRQEEE